MEKFKSVVIIVFLVVIGVLWIGKEVQIVNRNKTITRLRKELVEKDSIVFIKDGLYLSAIDDNNSLKDLNMALQHKNSVLAKQVKELNARVLMYQTITVQPKDKIDTVLVNEIDYTDVVSYYPSEKDVFVRFNRVYGDNSYIDSWKFNPLGIDVVLTEVSRNDFKAVIHAPEWISVNSVDIKALPLKDIKPDNFDWYTGITVGSNIGMVLNGLGDVNSLKSLRSLRSLVIGVDVGVRYKRNIYSVGAGTDNGIWLKYGRLW